jgi:hypothetical protein
VHPRLSRAVAASGCAASKEDTVAASPRSTAAKSSPATPSAIDRSAETTNWTADQEAELFDRQTERKNKNTETQKTNMASSGSEDVAATLHARVPFTACPLCDSVDIRFLCEASCMGHPMFTPALPATMSWLLCSACGHVFTAGYFTAETLDFIFSKVCSPQNLKKRRKKKKKEKRKRKRKKEKIKRAFVFLFFLSVLSFLPSFLLFLSFSFFHSFSPFFFFLFFLSFSPFFTFFFFLFFFFSFFL